MGAGRLAAAFLLALAVPLSEGLLGLSLAQGSLAALALLPWLVLAPLPRRAPGASASPWRTAIFVACLAFPPLLLGAGLDLARRAEARSLGPACGGAWLALFLWTAAAEHASGSPRARRAFAALWFVLLPGGAALRTALVWVPLRGGADPAGSGVLHALEATPVLSALEALDPLLWCLRWGRTGGLLELGVVEPSLTLLSALLVLLFVLALRARTPEERSP